MHYSQSVTKVEMIVTKLDFTLINIGPDRQTDM